MAGDGLEDVDARGEAVLDATFLVLLNGHHEPVRFAVPAHRRSVCWEEVIDSAMTDGRPRRRAFRGGQSILLEGRPVVVLAVRRPQPVHR